jgi:hypothetical protein
MAITWDASMKAGDVAIVVATLGGPVLAVQAQKWVERWRERTSRKKWIFQTLMTTRGSRLAGEHVQALNLIVLAFYGRRPWWSPGEARPTRKELAVLDAWRSYQAHLDSPVPQDEGGAGVWNGTTQTLFINLLAAIAPDVGYRFSREQLEKGEYSPVAHGTLLAEQTRLRRQAIELLDGKRSLKMDVEKFPVDPEVLNAQVALQKAFGAALSGDGALNVHVQNEKAKQAPAPGA